MKKNSNIGFLITLLALLLFFVYFVPFLSFYIGKEAFLKQNYIKAFKMLAYPYHLHRNNSDYRYYYAQTLTHLKPILRIQKDLFEISQSLNDDAARHIAVSKINEWRDNVNYNTGNNYIYNVPSEKGIIRWDTAKFPLKIAIENADNVPGYYRTEILEAFKQWSDAVDILSFNLVKKPAEADVLVTIAPMPANVCKGGDCQYIVGFTVPTIKHHILKKMTVTLYDKTPDGNYFSKKELFNTIMHELGHALGIMGHSYYEGDLMFVSTTANNELDYLRSNSSFQFLTDSDINTVKLLYKLIPDVCNTSVEELDTAGLIYAPIVIGSSREINERKVQEALSYIAEAPKMSSGYVDLAIAYSELGDNKKAIESFEKALQFAKSDSELYLVYYNLAVQYASMSKRSKALKYAQMAKEIDATDEVIELISKLR